MAAPTKLAAKPELLKFKVKKIWFNQKFETPKGPSFLYDQGKYPGSEAWVNAAGTIFMITYVNGETYKYSTVGTSWVESE